MFNIDNQSSRELRQYLTSIASRCVAKRAADDDDVDAAAAAAGRGGRGTGAADQLPSVIILDGLHRITTTPLGDIFAALLNVELSDR